MAYQAKRKKLYTEEFELVEEDGTIVHKLHVNLDADMVVKNLSEKQIALINVSKEARTVINEGKENENAVEILEIYGRAIVELIEACFGKENTEVIVDFYKERYMEMNKEVLPFITQTVIPEVRKIASENKKTILSSYNRKQRRSFLKSNK